MRTIKFRAWDFENEVMVNSDSLYLSEEFEPLIDSFRNFQTSFYDIDGKEHDKWDLMQFTGLKDKNGKEIYEGDIVESKGNFMPSKVNFRDGSFYFWDLPVTVSFGYEWEIIGNIHEGEKNDN